MKVTKIIALMLCLIIAAGVIIIPSAADTVPADRHKLTGADLIKAYGITPYGSDADVASAEIVEGKLVIKWGESGSYPKLMFSNVPTDLTKYTYKIDFITAEDTTNKANYMFIGKASKHLQVGFRTGTYTEGKNWANITGDLPGLGSGANTYSFGTKNNGLDLTSLSNEHPAKHTFEVSVNATGASTAEVSLTIDGIKVHETGVSLDESTWVSEIGLSGWKTNTMSYDNIVVTNDLTGQVVWSENFDDHSFGSTIVNVDENNHGYTCICGTSDLSAHVWNAGVDVEDANSCQGETSKKYTCLICSGEKVVIGKAHTPGEQKTVAAGCTEDGYTETNCTVCNAVIEHTVIEKTGHSYGLWVIVKEATATEDGEKQQTCEFCNDVKSKVIEKTGGDETTAGGDETTAGVNETTAGNVDSATTTDPSEKESSCGGFTAVAAVVAVVMSFGTAVAVFSFKKRG